MFFSWRNYIFKKYKKYKNVPIQVVIGPRNIGKSYGTYFDLIEWNAFTEDNKVLIFRNTDTELKTTKRDFDNRFKNKLIVKGDFIYNIEWIEHVNKYRETIKTPKSNKVVGYFASVNNYVKYKSIEAKNVTYIMYEEFNEDTVQMKGIYPKFFNILKTFERFNKLKYVFFLGNKDGYDSDFFVNWDIVPSDDFYNNKISTVEDELGTLVVIYDLGTKDFADLQNELTVSNRLATFDNRTNQYAVGGYAKNYERKVMNFNKIVPSFIPRFNLSIGETKYIFGEFELGYALLSPWNFNKPNHLINYSFDLMSSLMNDSKILELDDHLELLDYLFKLEKSNNLFYDSYDVKTTIADLLAVNKRVLQQKR